MLHSFLQRAHSLLVLSALFPLILLASAKAPNNQPPVAVDDSYTIHGGASPLTPDLTANDGADPDGDPTTIGGFPQLPTHGQLSRGAGNAVSYFAEYGYTGSDSFTYTLCDNQSACTTASVSLDIQNSPPSGGSDTYTVHGSADIGPLLVNDSDPDGDPVTIGDVSHERLVTSPEHGTLVSVTQPDRYNYVANYGYVGSDSFIYNVCDVFGACSTAIVSLDIVNQSPVGETDSYSVHGGTTVGPFLANDSDPDSDPITVGDTFHEGIVTLPQHGTLAATAQPDKKFYTPDYGYIGQDSFTYNVCDPFGACSTATVNLSINNNPPVAMAHEYEVRDSATTIGPLLEGAFDPDEGDSITMGGTFQESIVTPPEHGVLAALAQPDMKNYLPDEGFAGTDSFVYAICDNLGACSTATVTLYVVNDGENDGTSCSAIGGPINVTNGNMYLQQSDYSLPSVGPAIDVTRTFNSNSQRTGVFGRGWSTAYDESVTAYDNNLVRVNQADGRAIYFGRPIGSSSAFTPLVGDFHGRLTRNGNGSLTLSFKDGNVDQFSSTGKLLSMADRNGNTTVLTYDANGFLSSVTDPFNRVLIFTTNTNGQVLSITDSMGTIATYTYGAGNELSSVTYADNSAFQFIYDGNYRLTVATDALGNIVESHSYDSAGRALTSERQGGVEHYSLSYVSDTETDVTDALGHVSKYTIDKSKGRNVVTQVEGLCNCGGGGSQVQTWTYDGQLNITSKTDALNHTISYTYDGNGNRLTQTDATGMVTFTYNQFGEVLTRTDQMNDMTTNTYDGQGNLLSTTDARGKTTNFSSDSRGLLLTVTDARGKVTSFAYDSNGNLITKTDALSHATQFAYDGRARLTSVTNALGHVTAFAYDPLGRPSQITRADGSIISYEYDLGGRRTGTIDAKGNRMTYAYDGANRLTSETDALNQSTGYSYDLMSNLTAHTDALGRVTNYDYDDFNRPVKITYPPAIPGATPLIETLAYNAVGEVTQRTDTAGRVTSYAYDSVNRVISTTDADNKVTSYEYDALSRITAMVDAISQRYRFNYDSVGQLRHVRRGTDVMSFTYDAVGNRKQRTDYNGAITTYDYDGLNRLKTINYPDTATASYTYDKLSRLQTATNENGTVDFDYNKMNRLTSVTDLFGQVVDYNYDANGNRTKLNLNAATVATYRYDVVNRLTKILDTTGLATNYSYDATNKLTSRRLPNGVLTTYQYDGMDRLTRLLDTKGVSTIADHQYQYNTASQITQIAEPTNTRSYGYDAMDRLTSAGYTNPLQPNENYAYDGVGNRTSSHLSASYSYQSFNRLAGTSTVTFTYDLNGNMLSKTNSSGTTQFVWDFENRLNQVTLPNGNTIAYKYDALGRRIHRTPSAGVSTNFIYDGQDVVKDVNSDGSTVDYLNGLGIDSKLRLADSRLSATGPFYFLQDHLGSTTMLTNSLGVAVAQLSYDGFGNSAGSSLTRYDYTGRERDPDTGLMYYRARWYDSQLGRFVSEDPIGFDGGDINIYAYVGNSPIAFSDPLGLWEPKAHEAIIDEAFKHCLTEGQRQKLKDASEYIDGLFNGGQSEQYAYQHGMRGGPDQSELTARHAADNFIGLHKQMARRLAPRGCKDGYQKISGDALSEFGQSLHTITDMTSPAHAGFPIWYGPPYPTGITVIDVYNYSKWLGYVNSHHKQETEGVMRSDPIRFQGIKEAARKAFSDTFGDCGCCAD